MVIHLKILILIAGLSAALYANSLQNSFHFDDQHYIAGNPYIREISNIPSFFKSSQYSSFEKAFSGHYRPLLVASYAVNYAIGGLSPAGYHVVNLLFHIGSAFLVFLVFQAMLGNSQQGAGGRCHSEAYDSRPKNLISHGIQILRFAQNDTPGFASLAAALLFAAHPFNSEVVNYITARSSVMCSFFYLLSFYCWILFRSKKQEVRSKILKKDRQGFSFFLPLASCLFFFASLLAFILAMLTKEIAVTLPVMLFLYDLYFKRRSISCHPELVSCHSELVSESLYPASFQIPKQVRDGREQIQNDKGGRHDRFATTLTDMTTYIPYILLVILPYLVYRILVFGRIIGGGSRDLYANLLTQPKVLLQYLQLIFFPFGLTIDHGIAAATGVYDLSLLLSITALLLILTAAYLLYKRGKEWRVLSFFILWFFITLLPTTIIPLNAILQENRGYLAGIVFPLFAGICISKLPRRRSIPLLLILISLYSVLTVQRNSIWKDDYTLWTDAVGKAPASARAHDNLGLAYIGRREYKLAIAEFQKTLELQPRYYLAHYNAGVVYHLQNRMDMARSSYEACIRINPGYFRAYYNLGIVYKRTGDLDKAIKVYEKAIALDPRHVFVYNNLGVALTEKGEFDKAVAVFKEAIEINPRYEKAHFNLGNIYYKEGRYELAVDYYRSALRIKPDYKEAKQMLETSMKLGVRLQPKSLPDNPD